MACVAQGWTAESRGKQSAKANKASDLNTAAAWLLQTPIDEVPEVIRGQAKLLRDGLQHKTISKVVFAYAHNAFESQNVDAELQAVRHLLTGLDLTKDVEVEVVELGLRRIEALFLTSRGSIQVTEEIDLPAEARVSEGGPGWQAFVLSVNGSILYELHDKHKNALFSANLRDFLGARKASGNVNNRIKTTAEKSPGNFFVLNNGITLVTKKAEIVADDRTLRIHGVSVVNGAQTTGAIHAAGSAHAKNVAVFARVITVDSDDMIPMIVAGNNTQNSIVAWDRRSNNGVQIRIREEFDKQGVQYVHRRDSSRKTAKSLFADQVGQMLCAFQGDLQTAIRAKSDIFESDVTYNKVFPATISRSCLRCSDVGLGGWAYDRVKQQLKAKADVGMTELEEKQLRLLDFPASKQFLICVVGNLREEIAGRQMTDTQSFEVKQDVIDADGEEALTGC
jgi:AIPR protein